MCSDCGHERRVHIAAGAYPSLCVEVDQHGACPCLEFSDDPTPIHGKLHFIPMPAVKLATRIRSWGRW